MNDKKYPYISIDYANDKDSDSSEKLYNNKGFDLQKYEKFKPKNMETYYKNKTLKGAENKVKNLLSLFLKNYEMEKQNSDNLYENNKTLKVKEINNMIRYRNKREIKKVLTSVNNKKGNFVRSSSFNISLNNESMNNKTNNNQSEEKYFHHNNNHIQKRKVAFHLNSNNGLNINNGNKEFLIANKKKGKKKIQFNNKSSLNVSRTIKSKQKFNDYLQKTKSFGSNFLKRNKTGVKIENKRNNISSPQYTIGKNDNSNDTKSRSLIKKTHSLLQNNSYLNFKNDNIILNKFHKDNSISLKSSLKKKKGILKNKNKNEIFNDSIHNSILSDLSDYYLNKKSIIDLKNSYKEDESFKKEKKNSFIFSSNNKASSIIKKNLIKNQNNSVEISDLSINKSLLQNSLSPKKVTTNLSKSINNNKNRFKRATTSITDKKNKSDEKPKFIRLNTHLKSLKDQLKKSLILLPEELEISINSEMKKDKTKNNKFKNKVAKRKSKKFQKTNSLILNYKNNINLVKKDVVSKSNKNLVKIPHIINNIIVDKVKEENNIIKNE